MLPLVVVLAVGCGPPGLGGSNTSAAEGSTTEVGTDSSTSDSTESSTSTTETETSEPPTTEGESETWSFIPDPRDMPLDCDMYEQNCPDGEKCVPYSTGGSWDAYHCAPIMGDQAPGEPCTYSGVVDSFDDCDATSWCWDVMDVEGEWIGVCAPFCTGTADSPECPVGSACLIGNYSFNICITTCHPLLQDCGEGLACIWANDNFHCAFTNQDLPAGQPCRALNDCAVGLNCVAAEQLPTCDGASCCSEFCDLDLGDEPCGALLPGTACVPMFDFGAAPPGYDDVGLCMAIPPP
jgi:hypothetical protein